MNRPRLALCLAAGLGLQGCAAPSHYFAHLLSPTRTPVSSAAPAAADFTLQSQVSLYLDVIDGLVTQDRYGAALAFLDDYALKQNSLTPRYWLLRGDSLQGLGRGAEAATAYGKLDATALAAQGWNGKGRVVAAQKQWLAAVQNFRKAVQADPSNADFLNNLAFAEMHSGQSGISAGYLRQAHELDPDSDLIRNNLVIALTLTGDRNGAARILDGIKSDAERRKAERVVDNAISNGFSTEGKS